MFPIHRHGSGIKHDIHRGIGISVNNTREVKSVDAYFKKNRGNMDIELVNRDADYAIFDVYLTSPTLNEPLVAQIETRIDSKTNRSIDNPMETVNQASSFFHEATNDIFNKSRGKLAELYPDHKKDLDKIDFNKMESVAIKLQEQINVALNYGADYANKLEKETPKKEKKKSSSLSFAM